MRLLCGPAAWLYHICSICAARAHPSVWPQNPSVWPRCPKATGPACNSLRFLQVCPNMQKSCLHGVCPKIVTKKSAFAKNRVVFCVFVKKRVVLGGFGAKIVSFFVLFWQKSCRFWCFFLQKSCRFSRFSVDKSCRFLRFSVDNSCRFLAFFRRDFLGFITIIQTTYLAV